MQFTAKQPKLKRGLTLVSHAVPGRTTLPIEKYILATRDNGRVRLSARREDIGIHYWIDPESIEGEEAMLLPANLIVDFVANVPAAPVNVTSPSPVQPDACHVRCLRSSADMKNATDDPAEFPSIPSFAEGGEMLMRLDADFLKQIITQTAFAAADKENSNWPWLVGIKIMIDSGKAVFLATDSYRLAMYTLPVPDDQLRCTLLVPAKTMEELAKILPYDGTVQVMLTPNRNTMLFHVESSDLTESFDLSAQLLDVTCPDLQEVIPNAWTTRAVMRTQEFASMVRLMAPYVHDARGKIHFRFFGEQNERDSLTQEPNTVLLQTVAQDIGTIENAISAQVQGPNQEIYLHPKYLSEALAVLDTPEVALEVTAPNRPAIMKPVGPGEYVYVMVPMAADQPNSSETTTSSNGHVAVTTSRS
jgi:DNA polymerase-3 subunit beta